METRTIFRIFLGLAAASILGLATGLPLSPAPVANPLIAIGIVAGIWATGFLILWAGLRKTV
jgi:hypothetical protein